MPASSSTASSGFVSNAPQPALAAPPVVAAMSQAVATDSAPAEQHQDQHLQQQQEPAALAQPSDAGAEAVPMLVIPVPMQPLSEPGLLPVVLPTTAAAAPAGSDEPPSWPLEQASRSGVTGTSTASSAAVDLQAASQQTSSGAGGALAAAAEQPAADGGAEMQAASTGTAQPLPASSDAEGGIGDGGGGDSAISI